jgi:hypothetical protein
VISLWVGIIGLYLVLLRSARPRPCLSLYRSFLWFYCLRSLARWVMWFWLPAWYKPSFWPLYWTGLVVATFASRQALIHGRVFVFVGFAIYYGMDIALMCVPFVNDGVRIVRMLPAAMAAAWWLYGERRHVVSI